MGQNNKIYWDCEKKGCYNKKFRLKLGEFNSALPGKIAFTDIDGLVEVNNRFLIQEWKSDFLPTPTGQRILFERITKNKRFTVLVVVGDAETMTCEYIQVYRNGSIVYEFYASFDDLLKLIENWVNENPFFCD